MADAEQLAILRQGAETWRRWRETHATILPDLREANLAGADLRGANLARANLRKAELRGATLVEANLAGADLREADLQGADLSSLVGGLQPEKLAGADLTGAKLPEILAKLFNNLDAVKGLSDSAQKLFVAMLAACLYSWLTIATTTDVNLITNRVSSPLPIIQTSIPIVSFYIVTPLLLLGVYFYFHLYLQKLWEELGSLPAIFPDGRPLQAKADPWLLSDLLRSHVSRLTTRRPFLSYLQQWISILLAWWLVPITLLLFWVRFLARHDFAGTLFHAIVIATSITAAVFLYQLSRDTLRGVERRQFAWRSALGSVRAYRPVAVALASAIMLALLSVGAIEGVRSGASAHDYWHKSRGWRTWIPTALTLTGYSPFADLRAADLSQEPVGWTGKSEGDLDAVRGFQLQGVDLRYADLRGSFLAKTLLTDAHLEGADLLLADLRQTILAGAHMEGADLLGARLAGASLAGADIHGADLAYADLTGTDIKYANFVGATGITAEQLEKATNSAEAFYDVAVLKAMHLALVNNKRVRQQRKAEEESGVLTAESGELARVEQAGRMIPGTNREAGTIIGRIIRVKIDSKETETITVASIAPAGAGGPLSVPEIARLYDFPGDLDGRGQRIGIIELAGGYRNSDLDAYFGRANLPRPSVTSVSIDGQENRPTGDPNSDGQVELDVEVTGAVAPKAMIIVYFAPNTNQGFLDAINAAVHDNVHRPSVLLIDWGQSEEGWPGQIIQQMNALLSSAAVSGITVIASCGDDGAQDRMNDGRPHVDFPASSPWVLSVGGTKLVTAGKSIGSEVVWNDGAGAGATGGGVSNLFPQPGWQAHAHVPHRLDGQPGRGVPDVAANASPLTGYRVFIDGLASVIGGTSAAAPLWAGLVALVNQGVGHNVGFFNPKLYEQFGPGGTLRSILSGNNSIAGVKGCVAGSGWNACTGWGSPDGKKLLKALRAAAGVNGAA